jgi:Glycosyltransferase
MVRLLKVTLVRSRAIDPAINKVAKALSENGYDVKLLVWDRMGNKQIEYVDGYTVFRFGFKAPYDKISVAFFLPIWWLYELFFLLKQDASVIHVCDLDTLIPAIFAKFIKKTKLCYTIYDFYAGNFPDKFPSLFIKSIAAVEKFGIGFADYLFLVDECRFEQVKGAKIKNLAYIYNSPPDYFSTKQKHHSSTGEVLRIFYAGIISKSRGLEYIIKSIKDLDYVRLTIAGSGADKEFLENLLVDTNNKVKYIGQITYKDVIENIIDSDILFAFYDPSVSNNRYASPNKLFEAMMCGKPIIMNSEVTASKIVLEENCGLVMPYGDINAIKEVITRIRDYPDLRIELGENGRKAYEKLYSWNIMKRRLIDAYTKLNRY